MIIEYLHNDTFLTLYTSYNATVVPRVGDHVLLNGYEYVVKKVKFTPQDFIEVKVFVE